MGSATSVLIPQRLVHAGAQVSEAMEAFGVLCGMTLPMLCLPTAFIGALGLVLVPKLAEGVALGRPELVRRRVGRSLLATSVLILPAMSLLAAVGPDLGAALFGEPAAGRYILPLAAGVALSCYQSVLASALNGLGRPQAAARNAILSGAVELACVYVLMGLPGLGLRGYVAGFLVSTALGLLLNWRDVRRCTGPAAPALPVAHRPRPVRPAGRAGDQPAPAGALRRGHVPPVRGGGLPGVRRRPLPGRPPGPGVDLRRIFRLRTA